MIITVHNVKKSLTLTDLNLSLIFFIVSSKIIKIFSNTYLQYNNIFACQIN